MGKKKGGGISVAAGKPGEQLAKPSEPVIAPDTKVSDISGLTNGVEQLNISEKSAKELGQLARQQKSKEEVIAERKAKAAAKAAKAAAAEAKKAAGGPQQQPKQKVEAQQKPQGPTPGGHEHLDVPHHQREPEPSPPNIRDGHVEHLDIKSALKSAREAQKRDGREVQFDLTANTIEMTENLAQGTQRPSQLTVQTSVEQPLEQPSSTAHIHPSFLTLASRCDREEIDEVDLLCEEFIKAFKKFVTDWGEERVRTPAVESSALGTDLGNAIKPQLAHLTNDGKWPLPYALGNIVRQLKKEIQKLGSPDTHARLNPDCTKAPPLPGGSQERSASSNKLDDLQQWLDDAISTCFEYGTRAISEHLRKKMQTAKKIVTYDWCPVVNRVLVDSCEETENAGRHHLIVVLDKELNGRGMKHINSLIGRRTSTKLEYGDLRSLGSAMEKCNMVLLGCSAVLSNGCVACPKGSLQIALAAKANNIPLMVCAQTFKFVDKVQTYGRMSLLGREDAELVPADLVTAIVTDIRILPPSSAPAVLKAKALDTD